MIEATTIFDFSHENSDEQWQIVNDGVMGGLSRSTINLSEDGHGVFSGHVSLANNGGFASVMLETNVDIKPEQKNVKLKIRGDGKTYQFRLKASRNQRQSYVQEFKTNGDWQTISFPITEFSPQYRGRKLDIPDFDFSRIEEVRFLIGNKKEQDFRLVIDSIELE